MLCVDVQLSGKKGLEMDTLFSSWVLCIWHLTAISVGRCFILTAVSTLFTFCPPLPPDFRVLISRSLSGISISSALSPAKATKIIEYISKQRPILFCILCLKREEYVYHSWIPKIWDEALNYLLEKLSPRLGMTSTEAKLVCLVAFELKGDCLTSLCVPFSEDKYPYAKRPSISISTDFMPASPSALQEAKH